MAGPFNVVLFYPGNPTPHFWWRDGERRMADGGLAPQFSPNPQDAKFKRFHRAEDVIAERDRFRRYWPTYRIVIQRTDGSLEPQFEDRSAEVARTEAPADRQPWTCNGILIVPASLNRYAIRFPGSNFESIYAATADLAWAAYLRAIALRPEMAEFAEKDVTPETTDQQFAATIENAQAEIQRAQFPGRRRPGDH
jgi:hypothetical protein